MLKLPGLVDPHVHLREPGATHKEDFSSGTAAALAGGFTAVLAMPNTNPPLVDVDILNLAKSAAREKARCDYGIFLGAGAENSASVLHQVNETCGLKMYLDQTYGPLRLDSLGLLYDHVSQWPKERPIAVHAEGRSLAAILLLVHLFKKPIHVCHVSRKDEIVLIRKAKEMGLPITCEVTPHHLFLSKEDITTIGEGRSEVRPRLATKEDQQALWDHLEVIDCFATDHAPHTLAEKDSDEPPPGFPGLETALGLFLTAVHEGRLTVDEMVTRMSTNPRKIFHLPNQPRTEVEVGQDTVWEVRGEEFQSRSVWSPFEGMKLKGKVRMVILRGKLAYQDGEVHAPMGYGKDLISG
jgi:carbamoyl-phosphate synthase/aspartate carbamoyltransferase/dihydroorotase